MPEKTETLQGFVVDVACLRKHSPPEWKGLGPEHTTRCSLMGHCIESGFGLLGEDGRVALLDAEATSGVVDRLRRTGRETGVRLRVRREEREGEMKTVSVEEI